MYILGLSAYLCDSSAALLKDGEVLGAFEEEKLVGRKHTGELPVNAIRLLLARAKIGIADIAHVAYFFRPFSGLHRRLWLIARHLPASLAFSRSHGGSWLSMVRVREHLKAAFGLTAEPYRFHNVGHHQCHAASSFYPSGFDAAAVLTVDGSGEWTCTTMALADGRGIRPLKELHYPNSLGYFYGAVTRHLGFEPYCDEGKVMGLSSYGQPRFIEQFRRVLRLNAPGGYELDLSYFDYHRNGASVRNQRRWVSRKFEAAFGQPRLPGAPIDDRHQDIAASVQQVLNETLLHLADDLQARTGQESLCLAGGVALNSVANGYLLRRSRFKRLFIQSAAGDGGASLGAALHLCHGLLRQPRIGGQETLFLGPEFGEDEILAELRKRSLAYRRVDPAGEGAALLAEGKILGWFQGRAEFGPRALGQRSILADPRLPDMKDRLNLRVKRREPFRPFAPSILEERLPEYCGHEHPSPAMLLVYDVLPDKRAEIPAVTHVDGTARVQTVSRRISPLYYELIERFAKLTGVPVLLNTSMNVRGMPMAAAPGQALDCFLSTEMDALIMGHVLVAK